MTQGYVLEVRIGVAEPASIALVPGTPLDPTSFGRSAMWRIGAEGVLDIHGYVYFDGRSLFVQSADEAFAVLVNRHRVPMAWTEIRAPSTMFVGQAQIDLKVTDMLARSGALMAIRPGEVPPPTRGRARASSPPMQLQMPQPLAPFPAPLPEPDRSLGAGGGVPAPELPHGPWDGSSASPMPLPTPGAPFARGAFVPRSDGDSTRFAPLDPLARSGANPSSDRPGGMDDPRGAHTSPVVPLPLPLSAAAPPPKSNSLWARAKADWYATSLPKRILFLLSPLVVASYYSLLYGDDTEDTGASSSASSSSSFSSSASVSSPPAAPEAAPRATAPPLGATATASATSSASPDPTKTPKTLERAAVEALSAGDLPLAVQLYDRLAREHPENPAFEKAARIVRDRLDAGR